MNPHFLNLIMSGCIIDRLYKHQAHTSFVGLIPDVLSGRDKPDPAIFPERFIQFFQFSVLNHKNNIIFVLFLSVFCNLKKSGSFRILLCFSIFKCNRIL